MRRVNKTQSNLQQVWEQLDNASGELYNAAHNILSMVDLPHHVRKAVEQLDIAAIDALKNAIEELQEIKRVEKELLKPIDKV